MSTDSAPDSASDSATPYRRLSEPAYRLQHVLRRRLDAAANTVWWGYRVRIAIK